MAINDRLGTPEYSNFLSRLLNIPSNKIPNINPLTKDIDPFRYDNTGINKALEKQIVPSSFIGTREELINQAISNAKNKKGNISRQPSLDSKSTLGDIDVFGFGSVPSASSEDLKQSLIPDQSLEQNLIRKDNIINNQIAGMGEVGSSFIENKDGSGVALGGDPKAGLGGAESGAVDLGYGADMNEKIAAQEERNKAIIADESRMQQGQLGQETEEEPKSKYQENQDSLQALFTTAMEEQKQLFGDLSDDTGEKSIEDYKAQFQKATGIDVSGEPDNKMALMSLGLSLMQNKAGKGFNLSNILTSVGEAGEASMPAFQKAKDDARAGQVAAGKYALQQTQADEKTKLALSKEKRLALSALSKEFRTKAENRFLNKETHLNAMEQKELTETIKYRAAMIKAGADSNKVNKSFTIKPVDGQALEYRKAIKVNVGGKSASVFVTPKEDLGRFKNAAFNINRARARLGGLKNIVGKFVPSEGSGTIPVFKMVSDELKNYAVAFGVDPKALFKNSKVVGIDDNGNIIKKNVNVSNKDLAASIRDSLILEYKKFLTQETGNGISNEDVKRLKEAIGELDLFGNPSAAISRIEEIDGIFQKTQNQITNVITNFKDRDNYGSDYQYEQAMKLLESDSDSEGQKYTFGKSGKAFNVRTGSDGRMIYSLVKK